MKSKMNIRRLLLTTLVVVLAWKFFAPLISNPIDLRRENIAVVERNVEELRDRLIIFDRYIKRIRLFGKTSLPSEVTTASVRYQEWLRTSCESLGIAQPRITVSELSKLEGVGSKLQASIRTTSNIVAVGDLIDYLCAAKVTHRIVGVKLNNWDSQLQRMEMEVELEAIAMTNNPEYDPKIFSQEVTGNGLGSFLEDRQNFSRYQPPRPKAPEIVVSVEQPQVDLETLPGPTKTDILASIRLVGIIEKDGQSKAIFYDSLQQREIVVDVGDTLQLEQIAATIEKFDKDKVSLRAGIKEYIVALGQTIRQSVSSSSKSNLVQ